MSQRPTPLGFDFVNHPFDGDARQAHQLIPFIETKIRSHHLSYILNINTYPDPLPNELFLLLEQRHLELVAESVNSYRQQKHHYDTNLLPLYHLSLKHIAEDPNKTDAQKEQEIFDLPAPPLPVPTIPTSDFKYSMESQLSKTRDTIRRYDADADHALHIICSFLSARIIAMCSPVLRAPDLNSRKKLLTVWEWLKAKRINDPQLVGEIHKDMNSLPTIHSFDEAITNMSLLNQLQAELVTLMRPMSDLELILIHTNQYSDHDRFGPIKMKFLQRTQPQATSLPPTFDIGRTFHAPISPVSWSDYCAEVHQYARASGAATRTSTILTAQDSPAPPISAATPPTSHDTRRKHSHRSSKRAQHSSSRARSWAKRNQSPGQDVEDPLTFKAARAKAHRDTDKHPRKRPHKHAPASRSAHPSNVT